MSSSLPLSGLIIRDLGTQPYTDIWQAMSRFTDTRDDSTVDELWIVEHDPVYTQGQAGKAEHILQTTDIPIVQSDRGGQVTYHGPGQLILYPLINLRRRQLGVRDMVTLIEQWMIQWLASHRIDAYAKPDAPGVYINLDGNDAKIASLGLRVRRGCSFHGVSINIDMDVRPFDNINPCGYQGLRITQLRDHVMPLPSRDDILQALTQRFVEAINASEYHFQPWKK